MEKWNKLHVVPVCNFLTLTQKISEFPVSQAMGSGLLRMQVNEGCYLSTSQILNRNRTWFSLAYMVSWVHGISPVVSCCKRTRVKGHKFWEGEFPCSEEKKSTIEGDKQGTYSVERLRNLPPWRKLWPTSDLEVSLALSRRLDDISTRHLQNKI